MEKQKWILNGEEIEVPVYNDEELDGDTPDELDNTREINVENTDE